LRIINGLAYIDFGKDNVDPHPSNGVGTVKTIYVSQGRQSGIVFFYTYIVEKKGVSGFEGMQDVTL
jgi:hypothetical protein